MSFKGATRSTRRDANEPIIIEALEAAGCVVLKLSGLGLPDLAIFKGDRLLALAEVKMRHGRLTQAQIRWRAQWHGPAPVELRSVEDALALVRTSR